MIRVCSLKQEVVVVNFILHRELCGYYVEGDGFFHEKRFFFFHFVSNQKEDISMNDSIILLFKKIFLFLFKW